MSPIFQTLFGFFIQMGAYMFIFYFGWWLRAYLYSPRRIIQKARAKRQRELRTKELAGNRESAETVVLREELNILTHARDVLVQAGIILGITFWDEK